ncbi:enoyl-[acyl-carrier-protein] reductase, mitochondrial-like [Bacillus rossius redtenbacheri]|uniref:enoyl-[acyl-carrier-protein] reductase, mitochondrial-like n=1 Tax=Bacillus rossius redtenbacheri TaxID=93214 RepID=UPI002FDD886F
MSVSSKKLVFCEFGNPAKILKLEHEELHPPKPNEVLVRMLAAPINPADVIALKGLYPNKPSLPAVAGNEGVGEVVAVGSAVGDLRPGDRVVAQTGVNWGTWRTHAVCDAKRVFKIPKELGVVEAATMSVNPFTAYLMLKDLVTLEKGDVVVQNGANSSCGQFVIQLSSLWGYRTVNVVRDRPDIGELRRHLEDLGASYVLTEEELRDTQIFESGGVARPKLALNCVGGASGETLAKQLAHGGTLVTYGAMSRQPVPALAPYFIYEDQTWRGFWVSAWMRKHAGSPRHLRMLAEVSRLLVEGKLKVPAHTLVPIAAFQEALASSEAGFKGFKYIFDFRA